MNRSKARSCEGKVRHRSVHAARAALRESIRAYEDTTLIYYGPCAHCGGFHVGHPPKSEQKRLKFERLIKAIERAQEA